MMRVELLLEGWRIAPYNTKHSIFYRINSMATDYGGRLV